MDILLVVVYQLLWLSLVMLGLFSLMMERDAKRKINEGPEIWDIDFAVAQARCARRDAIVFFAVAAVLCLLLNGHLIATAFK